MHHYSQMNTLFSNLYFRYHTQAESYQPGIFLEFYHLVVERIVFRYRYYFSNNNFPSDVFIYVFLRKFY